MADKTTDDLSQELMSQADISTYINNNRSAFSGAGIPELLARLYEKKELSKAALARQAGMSEVYLHQVFSGRRNPSRDRLLSICIGIGATLEETQELLRQAAYARLYPKNKRDAIVSHGILHQKTLSQINDILFAENEKTLS